jgi:hypothetical protein
MLFAVFVRRKFWLEITRDFSLTTTREKIPLISEGKLSDQYINSLLLVILNGRKLKVIKKIQTILMRLSL